MLKSEEKGKIIGEFKIHETDTGSSDVQVAILSGEITNLLGHLKKNPKDFHSKRGLLKMVAKRRQVLAYLKEEDEKRYGVLVRKLGLKKQ